MNSLSDKNSVVKMPQSKGEMQAHRFDQLPRSVIYMRHETDCSDSGEFEEFQIEEKSEQSTHGAY